MLIIDFEATPLHAFGTGLLKGLAAPMMVFGHYETRTSAVPPMIELPATTIESSLLGDWQKVSTDIRKAVEIYGQTKTV